MWLPIDQDPPQEKEVALWLKADEGCEEPIGLVIAEYKNTTMGPMWCVKSLTGDVNTGLRDSLITHYCVLEGPNE